MSRFMTINQAANYLGVCPDTVRRHVRTGLLPAQRRPRGRNYQWLVEVPDNPPSVPGRAGGPVPASQRMPTLEEYQRLRELVDDLRSMLNVANAELEARRKEMAHLLSMLEGTPGGRAPVSAR